MALSGPDVEIADGGYRARIAETGAGLAGFWSGARPVTVAAVPGKLPLMSCGAVLVPWPNRIRDGRYTFDGVEHQLPLSEPKLRNASHGLLRWQRWQVLQHSTASVTLGTDVVPQTGWEFELQVQLSYTVGAGSGLQVALTATNVGGTALPFGAGFHPYLDLDSAAPDDAELEIPAATMLVTDERQIPTGTVPVTGSPYDLRRRRPLGSLRLDHAFTELTSEHAVLASADWQSELWWGPEFEYLQVFTPPIERFHRTAIAIEPMTCPANAFNSGAGLRRLEPGQVWTGAWGIRTSD